MSDLRPLRKSAQGQGADSEALFLWFCLEWDGFCRGSVQTVGVKLEALAPADISVEWVCMKSPSGNGQSGAPTRGAVVLRFEGFGVVTIVGCDPEAARVRDIAVEIAHSGFHTRAEVWVKARNGPSG
ncbi:unnamed protein product [Sphagnum tenellum]